jgi:hypothetical protein
MTLSRQMENSCMKLIVTSQFINTHCTKLHNSTQWVSRRPNRTSKFRTIAIFKSFVKENDSNKSCRYVMTFYCTKPHLFLRATVHELFTKQYMDFKFNRPPCLYFSFSKKITLLKVVHLWKIYKQSKFHGPKLTEATGLKFMESRSPSIASPAYRIS